MAPNELLVEVNNVSTPWQVGDAERAGGCVIPISWLFHGDQLIPYEFSFVGVEGVGHAKSQPSECAPQFLEEIAAALKRLKLVRYLSLIVHPGPKYQGSVEFTAGRANIVMHPSEVLILLNSPILPFVHF